MILSQFLDYQNYIILMMPPHNVRLILNIGNALNTPTKYITLGLDADVGIVVGSQDVSAGSYVAKSTACAFLQSNSRPIWGMIAWNVHNFQDKQDSTGFQ